MSDLLSLPNIGKVLAGELRRAGIDSAEKLRETGSVRALTRIRKQRDAACYSMLYALEGAIRGVRWHQLPEAVKRDIRKSLDETPV
jgi:DNA transformation protein